MTDQSAMIGTSNWTPDYFLKTGGIGFIFSSNSNTEEYQQDFNIADPKSKHKQYPRSSISVQNNIIKNENQIHEEDDIENMHTQLSNVFLRDWNSPYASDDI